MAAGRSLKSLLSRRRREDDGEDEEGPVLAEDSQSERSSLSEAEDDDADASSLGARSVPEAGDGDVNPSQVKLESGTTGPRARKPRKKGKRGERKEKGTGDSAGLKSTTDTEAMMNGLQIDESAQTVDFGSMDLDKGLPAAAIPPAQSAVNIPIADTVVTRQRREHEDYRKRRDADPAFIPNRGNFFMHDTRRAPYGQPPQSVRGAWAGRGRGRGALLGAGHIPMATNAPRVEQTDEQPWKHDLHDTINEELTQSITRTADPSKKDHEGNSARVFTKPTTTGPPHQAQSRVVSFSTTTLVGKVQVRVFLPGMEKPINFAEVPWKHYIRLPNHRPPLRRDKPVRVSLPEHVQRYIFPSSDRSFIFIPRQMRPNQQGYGRNNYQRNTGGAGFGGYSSRRTSMYGGSMYSASIAASRRSSMAGISRADAFSPNSFASGMPPPNRPVVRLPHGHGGQSYSGMTTPSGPLSGQHTPTFGLPQIHTYPLPQQPAFQGTPTTMVHQPRPQKTISVTGIESPAALQQNPGAQEPQPFHNQLPAHLNDHMGYGPPPAPYFSPRQQYQFPQQAHAGTPLSGIPEQAMHAQPFQPQNVPFGQQTYYAPYPPQHNFYYPPAGPSGYGPMPMYMAPPQGYVMSPLGQTAPPSHQGPPPQHTQQLASQPPPSRGANDSEPSQSQSGMVAHESNGMVFYLPASEAQQQSQPEKYQPAESFVPSYAMPGLPPPTPAPDTAYYYPPMPPPLQMQGNYVQH